MIHLPLPPSGKISKIIHVSDIHIRSGDIVQCRFQEFDNVFDNLFTDLVNIVDDSTVIIMTGDIFHNKNRIEAPGILLFQKLIYGLSNIAPLYIIQGNHDYRQDQHNTPDMISAFLHNRELKNVFYMAETGHYIANNVGFGVVSVKDTLIAGDTFGQVENLPAFPSADTFELHDISHKIALFHGTVNGCTLQNYTTSPIGYPLGWFKGYDKVILGDVHMQQVQHTNEITWGYSGSLVQQNFGETLFGHGFLVWNLDCGSVDCHHVKNKIGMVTAKQSQTDWFLWYDKRWNSIEKYLDHKDRHDTLLVRVVSSNGEPNEICSIMCKHGVNCHMTCRSFNDDTLQLDDSKVKHEEMNDFISFNSHDTWIQYISDKMNNENRHAENEDWREWILHPDKLCIIPNTVPFEVHDMVADRNNKLLKLIESIGEYNAMPRKKFVLGTMKWQWILCFKDDCWFDFRRMKGSIASINAKNACGKSSFLEVICIGLFGEAIPSRYNKEFSSSIICLRRPSKTRSKVSISFTLDETHYKLARTFDYQSKDKRKLVCSESKLYVVSDENLEQLHSGKTAIDEWIRNNIGNLEMFLLSSMLTQNTDQDFFSMKTTEQQQLLDKSLRLDYVNHFSDIFKTASLNYKTIEDNITTIKNVYFNRIEAIDKKQTNFEDIEKQYNDILKKRDDLQQKLQNIPEIWHGFDPSVLKDADLDLLKTQLDDLQKQNKLSDIDTLNQEKGILLDKLSTYIDTEILHPFQDVADFDEYNLDFKLQNLKRKLPIWDDKKKRLLQEYPKWALKKSMWEAHVLKQYGSISSLIEEGEKYKDIVQPSIKEDILYSQKQALQEEQQVLHDKHLFNCTEYEFDAIYANTKDKFHNIQKEKDEVNKTYNLLILELEQSRQLWMSIETDLKIHMTKPVGIPQKSLEEFEVWKETYESYSVKVDEMTIERGQIEEHITELDRLINERKEIQKESEKLSLQIYNIEREKHPYNNECWACQKQVWKIHLNNLTDTINNCTDRLNTLSICISDYGGVDRLESLQKQKVVIHKWFDQWNKLELEKSLWQDVTEAWLIYTPYKNKLDSLSNTLEDYRHTWETNEEKVKQYIEKCKTIDESYFEIKRLYTEVEYCKNNRKRWSDMEELITYQFNLWNKYNESISVLQLITDVTDFQQQLLEFDSLKVEQQVYESIHEQIQDLDDKITSLKYWKYKNGLDDIQQQLDSQVNIERLMNLLTVIPSYKMKEKLKTELEVILYEYDTFMEVYQIHKAEHLEYLKNKEDYTTCCSMLDKLKKTKAEIEYIHKSFSGYRLWLYQNRVIPVLLKETNRIISLVTNTDKLKLDVLVTQTTNQKLNFSWFVCDGDNKPTIEKASGFQKFMISLAIRISLSFMGASTLSCGQLFIDEGFVACDKYHLARVPEFLSNLLKIYESILIVSHLEELKEASSIQIEIKRDDGLSRIQYGTEIKKF